MAITLDGNSKRIILDSVNVSASQIWSAWVDWHVVNQQWPLAFRQVGGDSLGSGLFIPPYFFLMNGWRVRPMEANHDLTITGNLFVDGGGVPVVRTLGPYQVNVNYTVPVQAQSFATGGSNLNQTDIDNIVLSVWNALKSNSGISGSYGEHLKGLQNSSGSNVISVTAGNISRLVGSDQGGTLTTIQAHDDSYHSTGEVSGEGLAVNIGVTVNPSYLPNACRLTGYYAGGAGHTINILVYNFVLDVYEQKGAMLNRSTPFDYIIPLTMDNISSGIVNLMLEHSAGTYIASHRLYVDYVQFDFTDTVNSILSDIAAIKNKTDQLAFTLGRLNVNSQMISDNIAAADSVETNISNLNADLTEISNVLNQVKTLTMAGL